MCGIAGIVAEPGSDFQDTLRRMTRRLIHRGPDAEGFYSDTDKGIYLGHRRLSIIDLSDKGRQPMFNEDGSIAMVCNGEIYNHLELRRQLESLGHVFTSNSDSEVIVHAYEAWGEDSFRQFNGMFAIGIWDSRRNKLLLVRDFLGIKPLLYLDTPGAFFFASEAKAFLEIPADRWRPEFDPSGLRQLMTFQYIYDPELSLLKGVRKVPPGSVLVVEHGHASVHAYWTLETHDEFSRLPFDEATALCETKLQQSVRYQLQADVQVGILLSGGLDSSLIAALAARVSRDKVHTFTAGFEHALDERPFAAQVAAHVGSEHTTVQVDPRELNDRIEELVYHCDDMSSLDGGLFTIKLITEKVKQFGIKVLLVGEGGDEVFGGYSWYGLSQMPFRLMPRWVRSALFCYTISRLLPKKRTVATYRDIHRIFRSYREPDICRELQRFDITRELPSHFLMKEDRATMANAIEARVPFLDHTVVEFAYSLPREYKLAGTWFRFGAVREKHILREVARKHLPDSIAGRKKRGFSIPVPEMLMSNMDKVRSYLLANGSLARESFTRREIEAMLRFKNRMYSPLEKDKEFMVWKLFLLEVWKQHYLKRSTTNAS